MRFFFEAFLGLGSIAAAACSGDMLSWFALVAGKWLALRYLHTGLQLALMRLKVRAMTVLAPFARWTLFFLLIASE